MTVDENIVGKFAQKEQTVLGPDHLEAAGEIFFGILRAKPSIVDRTPGGPLPGRIIGDAINDRGRPRQRRVVGAPVGRVPFVRDGRCGCEHVQEDQRDRSWLGSVDGVH